MVHLVTVTVAASCVLQSVLIFDIMVPSAPGCWNELRRGSLSPSPAYVVAIAGDAYAVALQGAFGLPPVDS